MVRGRQAEQVRDTNITEEERKTIQQAIRQLHVNMGHPSNSSMARAMRVTGASNDAIQEAL